MTITQVWCSLEISFFFAEIVVFINLLITLLVITAMFDQLVYDTYVQSRAKVSGTTRYFRTASS